MLYRSLDKLKKQIKEAKEVRKQQKKEAKKSVGLFDGAEVTYPDSKGPRAVREVEMGEVEDLLVVKKVERPNLRTDSAFSTAVEEDPNSAVVPDLSNKKSKKVKKLKITMDGEVKDGGEQRKKIIFDDDGSTLADAKDGLAALFKDASNRSGRLPHNMKYCPAN